MKVRLSLRVRHRLFASAGYRIVNGYRDMHRSSTMPWSLPDSKLFFSHKRLVHCPAVPNGFTLMELLIVISIILILMLMAMPTVGGMRKHANETSAVNSVQAIVTAEIMYESSYPKKGFTCTLSELGGDPASGAPTPAAAQLVESDLASGYKSGYVFRITNCVKTTASGTDHVKGYTVTAVPEAVGRTGDRGFCINQNGGSPKYDPAGGTNCAQILMQ